ncbi:MAG: hypothetical protein WC986_11425 [Elusimicrobiota bacterium]|jgi:hypothetical protein
MTPTKKATTIKTGNTGLTVKVYLWPLTKEQENFDSERARLWIKGKVTDSETGQVKNFNDAGELVSILGKWNARRLKQMKRHDWKQGCLAL